ncbi:MAG: mechanosensitive ion channel family protein [bacterium]|nr:mechanosensitive ion channel family protein [bacterium]
MLETFFTHSIWKYEFLGNTVHGYAVASLLFLVLFLVFRIFYLVILNRMEKAVAKTATSIDDTALLIFRSLKPPFYIFIAFYFAVRTLVVLPWLQKFITVLLILLAVYQVIIATNILIDYIFRKRMGKEEDPQATAAVNFLNIIIKFALWVSGVLLVLSNLGVNINSLIAGLGVGGVAVAFALQNILSDLFSSFAIYFDKPFVVGDFIIVGDKLGVVKKIGIKTTRIQALQGEELVLSNRELTTSVIQNFKQMQMRRVPFKFGIVYGTSSEKVRKIPEAIKAIIEPMQSIRFDRAHFTAFGASSLDFEVVYYVDSADYNIFMDRQQSINLAIMEYFKKEKIEFAYPTQTVFFKK